MKVDNATFIRAKLIIAGYISGGTGVDSILVSGSASGDQDLAGKARTPILAGAYLPGNLLPLSPVTLKAVGERA